MGRRKTGWHRGRERTATMLLTVPTSWKVYERGKKVGAKHLFSVESSHETANVSFFFCTVNKGKS